MELSSSIVIMSCSTAFKVFGIMLYMMYYK